MPCDRHVKVGSDYNNTTVAADDSDDFVADGWISFLLLKCNSIIASFNIDPHQTGLLRGVENPIGSFLLLWLFSWAVSSFTRDPIYSTYIPVLWRFASFLTFGWTSALLKTNAFEYLSKYATIRGVIIEKCIVVDKLISIGMILVGLIVSADEHHNDLLPLVNVGGIGGGMLISSLHFNFNLSYSHILTDYFLYLQR